MISWAYLTKLNFESIFFKKETREQTPAKSLTKKESAKGMTARGIAASLCECDVVSFDVFDTLIFRPFAVPTDLFFCIGEKLKYPDFRTIRIETEKTARGKKNESVTLKDIYDFLSERTGIDSELGQRLEMETEMELCSANPSMKKVWDLVRASGKRIVLTSDMYLPSEFVGRLLEKNGFTGFEKVFISCECKCGKHMPSANHNIYFELLFSATEPSFQEFRLNGDRYELVFDGEAENEIYIREIQKGELDFISEYVRTFEKYPYMRNISGSDAYSPFMDAMKHSKKFIDKVFSECVFDETTNGKKVRIK